MPFSWEVDHESGTRNLTRWPNTYNTQPYPIVLRVALVCFEHFRVGTLELKSNSFPHDSDGIHGINKGVNVGFEQVSFAFRDHRAPSLEIPVTPDHHWLP